MLFAEKIKTTREAKGLLQRQLAAVLEIDTPMYSRIERGERQATRQQVEKISEMLELPINGMINLWLAEKLYKVIAEEENPEAVITILSATIENHKRLSK